MGRPSARRPGFDCSPLELEEALAPTTLAQQPITTPEGSTSSPASELNPDSEEVLEQQAREGNREALAKQAQNPIANLISVPIQWNGTPGSQWAPRAIDPSAQANRTSKSGMCSRWCRSL